MDEISRRYPSFSINHVLTLASFIAERRDEFSLNNVKYKSAAWGFACHACDVVKQTIRVLDKEGTYPWLRYVKEAGAAYTIVVAGVPLRVQPLVDEIRDVMPGERMAMRTQLTLIPDSAPDAILRLEVLQRPGEPVEEMSLFLFNEQTGVTLDSVNVYRRARAEAAANTDAAPLSPVALIAPVIPIRRPPQDANKKSRFRFNVKETSKDADGNEGDK